VRRCLGASALPTETEDDVPHNKPSFVMGSWQLNLQHLVPYGFYMMLVPGAIIYFIYLTGDREGYDCTFYAHVIII
jgi:hypothetical protein